MYWDADAVEGKPHTSDEDANFEPTIGVSDLISSAFSSIEDVLGHEEAEPDGDGQYEATGDAPTLRRSSAAEPPAGSEALRPSVALRGPAQNVKSVASLAKRCVVTSTSCCTRSVHMSINKSHDHQNIIQTQPFLN